MFFRRQRLLHPPPAGRQQERPVRPAGGGRGQGRGVRARPQLRGRVHRDLGRGRHLQRERGLPDAAAAGGGGQESRQGEPGGVKQCKTK